jgi:adenylate cyclase class IV
LKLGALPGGVLRQTDTYFIVPHGRMKLRVHEDGPSELISYDRPDLTGERWSTYRKIDVTGAAGLKEALTGSLGILCIVKKRRFLFLTPHARIHVDEVENLGAFLEFEVTVGDVAVAEQTMAGLQKGFGVTTVNGIGGSYSDLLLANRG